MLLLRMMQKKAYVIVATYSWLVSFCGVSVADARGAPIDVYADSLKVDHKKCVAVFAGNVTAKQTEMTISADQLHVYYKLQNNIENDSGITKLSAHGHVMMVTPKYKVYSENGEYDIGTEHLILTKNVLLEHGENKMHGQRFVYNHKTQKGEMAATGNKDINLIVSSGKNPKVKVTINPETYDKPAS